MKNDFWPGGLIFLFEIVQNGSEPSEQQKNTELFDTKWLLRGLQGSKVVKNDLLLHRPPTYVFDIPFESFSTAEFNVTKILTIWSP